MDRQRLDFRGSSLPYVYQYATIIMTKRDPRILCNVLILKFISSQHEHGLILGSERNRFEYQREPFLFLTSDIQKSFSYLQVKVF